MVGIDPSKSRAILIGATVFPRQPQLSALPSVKRGVEDLKAALCDPDIVGLPESHVTVLLDERDLSRVQEKIWWISEVSEDCLFLYYAGHGCIGKKGDLYLALPTTTTTPEATAIDWRNIHDALKESAARKKVLILDCCFSGRAIEAMAGEVDIVRAALEVKGVFGMSSSPRNQAAIAPLGERYPAFTGALLRVLREGCDSGRPMLTLDEIFELVRAQLKRREFPVPERSLRGDAGTVGIARNRYGQALVGSGFGPALLSATGSAQSPQLHEVEAAPRALAKPPAASERSTDQAVSLAASPPTTVPIVRNGSALMAREAFLDIRLDDGLPTRHVLSEAHVVVGRLPTVQLVLDHHTVSRRHAEMACDPLGGWWIRDLGSTNGTIVNNEPVAERRLIPGDTITIGDYNLTYQESSDG